MKRLIWRYNSKELDCELTSDYSSFRWKERGTVYSESWNVMRVETTGVPNDYQMHAIVGDGFSRDGLYGFLPVLGRKVQSAPIPKREWLDEKGIVLVCSVEWGHILPDHDKELRVFFNSVRFPKCEVLGVYNNPSEAMEFILANSHISILHEEHCKYHSVTGIDTPLLLSDCTCNDKEKTSGYNAKDIRGISREAQMPLLLSLKDKYPVLENELETVLT